MGRDSVAGTTSPDNIGEGHHTARCVPKNALRFKKEGSGLPPRLRSRVSGPRKAMKKRIPLIGGRTAAKGRMLCRATWSKGAWNGQGSGNRSASFDCMIVDYHCPSGHWERYDCKRWKTGIRKCAACCTGKQFRPNFPRSFWARG